MNKRINAIIHRRYGGYYFALDETMQEIQCSLKGSLRKNESTTNLVVVGDRVGLEILEDGSGIIEEIHERKSALMRAKGYKKSEDGKPARSGQVLISNIDQVFIVLPAREPDFHPLLLDRFLALVEHMELLPIILINKWDLISKKELTEFKRWIAIYESCGYKTLSLSILTNEGMIDFLPILENKTSFLMGPSGAGKSSLVSQLNPQLEIRIGQWSKKCKSGQQTTTATQIYPIKRDCFIADTAGFSQIFLRHIPRRHLRFCYPDFGDIEPCKYHDCIHDAEDGCQIKEAVLKNEINEGRYERYLKLLQECDPDS